MYWYRQRSQGELSLVAFSLGKDNAEILAPFTDTKYTLTRPQIKESSLDIKDLVEEDSGIYFCASSITQYLNLTKHLNNNPNLSHSDKKTKTKKKIIKVGVGYPIFDLTGHMAKGNNYIKSKNEKCEYI